MNPKQEPPQDQEPHPSPRLTPNAHNNTPPPNRLRLLVVTALIIGAVVWFVSAYFKAQEPTTIDTACVKNAYEHNLDPEVCR
jgi:hypothetical protein